MPMDFPDMQSLLSAAEVHKFRQPRQDETEAQYRAALANHVAPIDFIESEEIRNGHGWNQFTDDENKGMLFRAMLRNK